MSRDRFVVREFLLRLNLKTPRASSFLHALRLAAPVLLTRRFSWPAPRSQGCEARACLTLLDTVGGGKFPDDVVGVLVLWLPRSGDERTWLTR